MLCSPTVKDILEDAKKFYIEAFEDYEKERNVVTQTTIRNVRRINE